MTTPLPLALSDSQLTAIMGLARPLQPAQRVAFLQMVAAKLNGQRELGDCAIYRLCRELQHELFSPPEFGRDSGASRSRRGRPRFDNDDDVAERPRRRNGKYR